jgi:biotin/methionine sulfoxide reductase
MLALAYVLVSKDLHDREFLARCTTGFARFPAYLLGETDGVPETPALAEAISGIPSETAAALARRMAASRTMITVARSVQRADHGEQPG